MHHSPYIYRQVSLKVSIYQSYIIEFKTKRLAPYKLTHVLSLSEITLHLLLIIT